MKFILIFGLMLLTTKRFCFGVECVPSLYDTSNGNPTQRYCQDVDGGGVCTGISDWTWVAEKGCRQHAGDLTRERGCPCSVHDCGSGNVRCQCGSSYRDYPDKCFTKTSYCDKCTAGMYRFACGCILKKDYGNEPYIIGTEDVRTFTLTWACGSGTCAACPKGHLCPPSEFPTQPTPCPDDTFQNLDGQTSCTSTLCEKGKYNSAQTTDVANKSTFIQTCVVCDLCTTPSLIKGTSQQEKCPVRDYSMGMIDGVCKKCLSCTGRTYAMVDAAAEFCLKDISNCKEQYYDNNVDLNDNPMENQQSELSWFKQGKMPWKATFMRTEPLYRNVAGKEGVGRRGMIPYYTPCASDIYSGRYRSTTNQNLKTKLNDMNWNDDCSPFLTRECNPNYYAILSSEVFEDGFRRLISCEPCQENTLSVGTGGLITECRCKPGFVSQQTLRSKFGLNNVFIQGTAENVATCVNCGHGVYWRHHGSDLVWQEALVCLGDTVDDVRSCIGGEYWKEETGRCVQCPVINPGNITTIPKKNRIGCETCPIGTHNREGTDGFTCEDCVAVDDEKYQDLEGQAECKQKSGRCNTGSFLMVNYDNDRDNECKPCPADCGAGQITIMSPNKTKSKDTCDGNKNSFFGCFDEGAAGVLGVSPDKRLVYTSIDQMETRATMETCNRLLLPNDAEWVSYRTPNAIGAECYFACLHGVNHAVSQTINSLILSHVYSERQDLINHLVSNPQGLLSTVANINADTMWALDLPIFTSTSSRNWNVQVQNPVLVSDGVIGKAFSSNTFLFIDEVMKSFNLSSLCVPAEKAYSVPCLDGYVKPVGWMKDLRCAWHARTNLFHISIQASSSTSSIAVSGGGGDNVSNSSGNSSGGLVPISTNDVHSVACMGAVSTSTQCSEICQSENGDLSRFRAGCTENCMDRHLRLASIEQEKYIPFTRWYSHLAWIKYFLQASTWSSRSKGNPYIMIDSPMSVSNCLFRCSSPDTFRYSTQDHILPGSIWDGSVPTDTFTACVPCSLGQQICSEFNPPRYFLSGLLHDKCANDNEGRELTTESVCSRCEQEKPNAVIIVPGSERYSEWLTSRLDSTNTGYTRMDHNGNRIWELVLCRYTCNDGYTSASSSPEAYNNAPCVPCDEALPRSCKNNTDRGIPTYKTTSMICGDPNNFMPYISECALCNAGKDQNTYLFFTQGNASVFNLVEPYASQGDCLAICNPNIYHSVRTAIIGGSAIVYVETPIPFKELECHSCIRNPSRPCGAENVCPYDGFYYRNASSSSEAECISCNTNPCPLDYYREMCIPGYVQDAQCLPCPESALYNDLDSNHFAWWSPSLLSAVQENQNRITRKWIYGEGGMAAYLLPFSQCKVACINNYAWVNLSSGLSPIPSFSGKLTSNLYCLPCIGSYISSGLTSSQLLYSFWNSTNTSADVPATLPGSALDSMIKNQVLGGCYTCPGGGIRDVVFDSKEMCEIRAGKTENSQGSFGVAIISPLLSVSGIVDMPNFMDWSEGGNISLQTRRRLLSTATTNALFETAYNNYIPTVKLVRVRLQPLVANGDYFTCCSKLSRAADKQDCQRQWVAALEKKKNMEGQSWGVNYCETLLAMNNGGRRLLSSPSQSEEIAISMTDGMIVELDDVGTCFSGTYKEKRGQGPCYICPAGSSTSYPYTGATNRSLCMCMPGYYSIRNISTKSLLHCEPCGHNHSRGPLSVNDSVCFPCAENSYAPTPTSSYCYCNPGTYRNSSDSSCVFCEPGFYCSNNLRKVCPPNSISAARSSNRGDCICDSKGYYGALFDSDSQCILSPPGLTCMVSGVGALSCSCAAGWSRLIDSFTVDAGGGGVLRAHCESPCALGQYAVLVVGDRSIEKCVSCPENSYSSNSQAIEFPGKSSLEQCTPCPPNSHTGGKVGVQSILDCSCSSNNISTIGCGICEGGSYMERGLGCLVCPIGTTSTPGGNGIQACLCPPGNRAVKVFNPTNSTTLSAVSVICEPCPRGYFSRNVGLSCTQCGKDLTTAFSGSKSLRDCI